MSPNDEHILVTMVRDLTTKVDSMDEKLRSAINRLDKRLSILEGEHESNQEECKMRSTRRLALIDAIVVVAITAVLTYIATLL